MNDWNPFLIGSEEQQPPKPKPPQIRKFPPHTIRKPSYLICTSTLRLGPGWDDGGFLIKESQESNAFSAHKIKKKRRNDNNNKEEIKKKKRRNTNTNTNNNNINTNNNNINRNTNTNNNNSNRNTNNNNINTNTNNNNINTNTNTNTNTKTNNNNNNDYPWAIFEPSPTTDNYQMYPAFNLSNFSYTIGSDEYNDLVIPDTNVSAKHAVITQNKVAGFIANFMDFSKTGTWTKSSLDGKYYKLSKRESTLLISNNEIYFTNPKTSEKVVSYIIRTYKRASSRKNDEQKTSKHKSRPKKRTLRQTTLTQYNINVIPSPKKSKHSDWRNQMDWKVGNQAITTMVFKMRAELHLENAFSIVPTTDCFNNAGSEYFRENYIKDFFHPQHDDVNKWRKPTIGWCTPPLNPELLQQTMEKIISREMAAYLLIPLVKNLETSIHAAKRMKPKKYIHITEPYLIKPYRKAYLFFFDYRK